MKYPTRDEAKHAFYGVAVNPNFVIYSKGDTLRDRGVTFALDHYPNGWTFEQNGGFDGESHLADEDPSYRYILSNAKNNVCEECGEK